MLLPRLVVGKGRGAGEEGDPLCINDHLPSMGVLLSGRLANTTSTYSSCILWREPFKPAGRREEKLKHV